MVKPRKVRLCLDTRRVVRVTEENTLCVFIGELTLSGRIQSDFRPEGPALVTSFEEEV